MQELTSHRSTLTTIKTTITVTSGAKLLPTVFSRLAAQNVSSRADKTVAYPSQIDFVQRLIREILVPSMLTPPINPC